jgi:hypothetical protein
MNDILSSKGKTVLERKRIRQKSSMAPVNTVLARHHKTPMETFFDTLPLAKEKNLDDSLQTTIEQNETVCQMK